MASEIDRIFDMLQDQGRALSKQGETLATIAQSQLDTHERLFGSGTSQGAIPYLHEEVNKHSRQISAWKGGLAVMTFLWGIFAAWLGFKHH